MHGDDGLTALLLILGALFLLRLATDLVVAPIVARQALRVAQKDAGRGTY